MVEKIIVGCAFDDKYITHAAVMLYSLLKNTKFPEKIKIYAVFGGKDKKRLSEIKRMCSNFKSEIKFIQINPLIFSHLKTVKHINQTTFYRLVLPNKIKENKVIFLDTDLIVNEDISKLWSVSLKDKLFACVQDNPFTGNERKKALGIPKKYKYFNAGVIVINALKWKKLDVTNKTIKYLKDNQGKLVGHEQDALNALFYDDWIELPKHWNWYFYANSLSSIYSLITFKRGFDLINDKIYQKLNKLEKAQSIIHFVGKYKPWDYERVDPLNDLYWHYYKDLYGEFHFNPNFRQRMTKIMLFLYRFIPAWLLKTLVFIKWKVQKLFKN